MAPGTLLQRNIRPSATTSLVENVEDSHEEHSDFSSQHEDDQSDAENDVDTAGEDVDLEDEDDVKQKINNVSFGALLEAQEALSPKRKRGSETTTDQEAKLEGIRSKLRGIRSQKDAERGRGATNSKKKRISNHTVAKSSLPGDDEQSEEDHNSDSDSPPSEEGLPSRTSKHAPASQTSKRQVTRKRTVIHIPKSTSRDPRFDALRQTTTQPSHSEKAYSFLVDYQKSEIAQLKTALKAPGTTEEDKALLRRKLVSMENRLKSKDAKDRAQEVLRAHRREEKGKVEGGKKPYFLKRSELKERALVEKFKGMKSKEREKLMERRKKKESQKEMRRMPNARRVAR